MKVILFLIAILPFYSNAQFWVEDNAVWHYDYWNLGSGGYYKVSHVGQSTISSVICEEYKIERQSSYYVPANGGTYIYAGTSQFGTEYLHESNDTIFRWDGNSHRVLFDFGAQVGDEWIIDVNQSAMGISCNDTSRVTVLAAGIENILGQNYRYLDLFSDQDGYYSLNGHFNERFGGDYFLPYYQNCDPTVAVEFDIIGNLRCFEDDSMSVNFVSEDCEYIITHSGLPTFNKEIEVYPNPTAGNMFINNSTIMRIDILSSEGRLIEKLEYEKAVEKFSIDHLKPGVYFLNLHSSNDKIFTKKILLQTTE